MSVSKPKPLRMCRRGFLGVDSPEAFYNHWIVRYGNLLFDPSYGTAPVTITDTAQPLLDYETGLAGYHRECNGQDVFKKESAVTEEMVIFEEYSP